MTELANLPPGNPMTAGEIKQAADEKLQQSCDSPSIHVRPKLRQVLIDVVGNRGEIDTRRLGKLLGRFNGRIVDGRKLEGTFSKDRKQLAWKITSTNHGFHG